MPTTADQIFNEALSLPLEARAYLIERLVARLAEEVPGEIARAQLDEVHRRIAQVDSGEVSFIPGGDALARVRRLFGEHSATDE
jgi:putative addiction module component (TIGR02574 family)